MRDLEKKSKKELIDIVDQLMAKLSQMQNVEAKQNALEQTLDGTAVSIVVDRDDKFQLVELEFDFDSKAGRIKSVEQVYPSNYEFALFQAKKFLVDKVMNKQNLNHLKEK
jgi:hypothetical protein